MRTARPKMTALFLIPSRNQSVVGSTHVWSWQVCCQECWRNPASGCWEQQGLICLLGASDSQRNPQEAVCGQLKSSEGGKSASKNAARIHYQALWETKAQDVCCACLTASRNQQESVCGRFNSPLKQANLMTGVVKKADSGRWEHQGPRSAARFWHPAAIHKYQSVDSSTHLKEAPNFKPQCSVILNTIYSAHYVVMSCWQWTTLWLPNMKCNKAMHKIYIAPHPIFRTPIFSSPIQIHYPSLINLRYHQLLTH